jgi:hypothetical protein
MYLKPLIEAGGDADIVLTRKCETLDAIDVLHEAVRLRTRTTRCLEGSLRKTGLPAEVLAKAGGGQPMQPWLVPLLRFEIQGFALVV